MQWLAAEEEIPGPMAGLKPPQVPNRPVPVFAGLVDPRGALKAGQAFHRTAQSALLSGLAGALGMGLEITSSIPDPSGLMLPQEARLDRERAITLATESSKVELAGVSGGGARAQGSRQSPSVPGGYSGGSSPSKRLAADSPVSSRVHARIARWCAGRPAPAGASPPSGSPRRRSATRHACAAPDRRSP